MDRNHGEIVAALRAVGCKVQSLAQIGGGVPDLLVGTPPPRRVLVLLEVKDGDKPPSQKKLTPQETEWHQLWGLYPVFTVFGTGDAIDLVRLFSKFDYGQGIPQDLREPEFESANKKRPQKDASSF